MPTSAWHINRNQHIVLIEVYNYIISHKYVHKFNIKYLSLYFRIASVALEQSSDWCPSSEKKPEIMLLWKCYPECKKINTDQVTISQCHNSPGIIKGAKLWPDRIIAIKITAKENFHKYKLWAPKLFVKWVPGNILLISMPYYQLTHWGWVTHICVSNLTIIGSDNGLSPGRRQAIIWTNAGILLIGPIGTNFSEILIKIITFSFRKISSKVSSRKRLPSCLSLNVLTLWIPEGDIYVKLITSSYKYMETQLL